MKNTCGCFSNVFVLRIEQMATRNKMLFPDVTFCELGASDPERETSLKLTGGWHHGISGVDFNLLVISGAPCKVCRWDHAQTTVGFQVCTPWQLLWLRCSAGSLGSESPELKRSLRGPLCVHSTTSCLFTGCAVPMSLLI